jgi:hypothetical protein
MKAAILAAITLAATTESAWAQQCTLPLPCTPHSSSAIHVVESPTFMHTAWPNSPGPATLLAETVSATGPGTRGGIRIK